ncbi:Cu+-exporting ATPase [Mycoplasma testudineum]|uniref:Cu+-exporting ATPase n=1 Tax=Mycoplasma testudineum TaxID=244584 RepID=A0A4R6IFS8_9MOLU|nr:cation-translocating P-type ATPase [Mycoplasma testudineum]OYD26647.1 hypothetical protein CG473_02490 [Mycoplasma testudineum]TDO19775.1 Cu+-exporting ATPase [Mycoplasma testudineum]
MRKFRNRYYQVINKKYEFYFAWIIAISLLSIFIAMIVGSVRASFNDMTLMHQLEHPALLIYMLIAATYIQFWVGYNYYSLMYKELFIWKSLGMNTLVGMSTLVAYLYSVVVMIMRFSNLQLAFQMEIAFEAGALIIMILLSGDKIADFIRNKSISDLDALEKLKSRNAIKLVDGQNIEVSVNDLMIGDLIVVAKGALIPVDSVVVKGQSDFDESLLTGESLPIHKSIGDKAISGSINLNNSVILKVVRIAQDSYINQIVDKVEEIQSQKGKIQKLADKIAKWFTPTVIIVAILGFIITYFLGDKLNTIYTQAGLDTHFLITWNSNAINANAARISSSFYVLISILIAACPCAIGLAIPLALAVGVSKAAKSGISVNNIESFEKIKEVKAIAFDKTGTITTGKFNVNKVINTSEDEEILKTLEMNSLHPLAKSVVQFLNDYKSVELQDIKEEAGIGVFGKFNNFEYSATSLNYALQNNFNFNAVSQNTLNDGSAIVFAKNNTVINVYLLKDELRKNTTQALAKLNNLKIKSFLISGDKLANYKRVSQDLNFESTFFEVSPEQKAQLIVDIKKEHGNTAYVGDGINDLLALETADFKITFNEASEAAKKISDIILLDPDLNNVNESIKIVTQIRRFVKSNFAWAFIYNILVLPISVIGFINPILAALLMSMSSISVVFNSLIFRLRKVRKD